MKTEEVQMSQKEAYQEKADAQLREWQKRIERIKPSTKTARPDQPANEQRAFERLEDCYRIAQIRLDELRVSRDEKWEIAKQAVERAMIDLKRALDESGVGKIGSIVRLQSGREHVYEPFEHRKG